MRKFHLGLAAVGLAAATLLVACGGGDDGPSAPSAPSAPTGRTTDVPAAAQQSVSGLLAYINELIGATSETSEPILVGDATLPVDDTALPSP